MVNIVSKYRCYTYSKQREDCKYCFGTLTHITHITEDSEQYSGKGKQAILHTCLLHKITCKRSARNDKHNAVLKNCHRISSPERVGGYFLEYQITLQHIYGIFLEREYSRIIKYTKKRYQPESATGQNSTEIADLERIVFLLSLTRLLVKFLIHEEVDNKHNKCDKQ